MKTIVILFLFLGTVIANIPTALGYGAVDQYQKFWTREQIEKKLDDLVKHPEILNYFKIYQDRLEVYSSPDQEHLEYTYYFALSEKEKNRTRLSWDQLRVAINPSHIGGTFGILEGHYIKMAHDPSMTFQEADLNLYTAWALEDLLKAQGVTTLLLKGHIGLSSFNMSYEDFSSDFNKKVEAVKAISKTPDDESWWMSDDHINKYDRNLFKLYDYVFRKEMNQQFQPDITISIGHNVCYPHKVNSRVNGETFMGDRRSAFNYHMVFVPGAYMKTELNHIERRQHFLRWLVSGEFEDSVRLGHYFMEELEAMTGIAPVQSPDALDYLNDYRTPSEVKDNKQLNYLKRAAIPLETDPVKGFYGVSARNLYMSTFIGAVIIGESFCQESSFLELSRKDATVRGEATSSLILDEAQSYFNAIERFLQDGLTDLVF